jgi:hypothetical protein
VQAGIKVRSIIEVFKEGDKGTEESKS